MRTNWKGTDIAITEKTAYPNDLAFEFQVEAEHPVNFTLAIRKPAWATGKFVSFPCTEKEGYILITRTWRPGETLHFRLYCDPVVHRDRDSAAYFTYGPLVLAHAIAATPEITKHYPLPGFYDFRYRPDHLVIYSYTGGPIEHSGDSRFEVTLYDAAAQKNAHIWLTPMGRTILRQVTFPRM